MFEFMDMMMDPSQSYANRKVARYEGGEGFFISTCSVPDSQQPYETAVAHPKYNGGELVIVECYDTKGQAQAGHERWVALMTAKDLPPMLKDVSTAACAMMLRALGDNMEAPFEGGVEE